VMEIEYEHDVLRLDRKTCTDARTRARRSRRPHNPARRLFVSDVLDALTRQAARKLGEDLLDGQDLQDIRAELAADENIAAALNSLWPVLTPAGVLDDLFADRERLSPAAGKMMYSDDSLLLESGSDARWTPADDP